MNIAIVISKFNDKITSRMLQIVLEKIQNLNIEIKYTCNTYGVFDMPIIVDTLLAKNDVDAIITLGAIIKGKTKHDELIANVTAYMLSKLSLKYKKPISLGISGPCMNEKQAYARIRPVSERAVNSIIMSINELKKL